MTVYYDEREDLIFELNGKKYDVNEESYQCGQCDGSLHVNFEIRELDFISHTYYSFDKDDLEDLNKEILDHIIQRELDKKGN